MPISAASIDSTRHTWTRAGEISVPFGATSGDATGVATAGVAAAGVRAIRGEAMTCHHFRLSGANGDRRGLTFARYRYCSDKCVTSYSCSVGAHIACRDNEIATQCRCRPTTCRRMQTPKAQDAE